MKRIIAQLLLPALFFFSIAASAQSEQYTLDPSHSYVVWKVNHFGFSHPTGKWIANGTLQLDEANPENSKVKVTITLANLATGIPKFDAHLKSADFFDIKKFPTATFESQHVERLNKNTAKVTGMLTLHGVTKPVVLHVTLNKVGESPITQRKTVGFTATTTLKRSDFGLGKYVPGVSDDVAIDIEAEAAKPESVVKTN